MRHLEHVNVPLGTVFTIWSTTTPPHSFGLELASPGGDVWSPSVAGEDAFLEARFPGAGEAKGGFEVREIVEIIATAPADAACLVDATCISAGTYSPIADVRKAIAQLEFIDGADAFVCTGGLLNDTDNSTVTPLLLTANHCISTQASASTLRRRRTSDCVLRRGSTNPAFP